MPDSNTTDSASSWPNVVRWGFAASVKVTGVKSIDPTALRVNTRMVLRRAASAA
jgi:hypothetical protein